MVGMGIRGKKRNKEKSKMFRAMGSDFVMIKGEGILRVRNKNQAKRGRN